MLEPGTGVSHAAVVLAARAGTSLIWVGEAGVRLCAAGQPGGARADRLLLQARSRWTMTCVCVWCVGCIHCDSKKIRQNDA
jgi:CRISPR/Cas system-associated endonuclease Cas1